MYWFESELYNFLKEIDTNLNIKSVFINKRKLLPYLNGFIKLKFIKKNYRKYIEICNFLCVTNIDVLVGEIVKVFETFTIINKFHDFYETNSQRLKPHTNESLRDAIKLWCEDKNKCFMKYGYCSYWDVHNVTNFSQLFADLTFNEDIIEWDVSNVICMEYMFYNSTFNMSLNKWNVSNVKTMEGMFMYNLNYNSNISDWDVSNVTDMSYMFWDTRFNDDISKWDVSSVTCMDTMFSDSIFNGDISKWDVSNVKGMGCMFENSKFNGDISEWNVLNVQIMTYMFKDSIFNGDISMWEIDYSINIDRVFMGVEYTLRKVIFEWKENRINSILY